MKIAIDISIFTRTGGSFGHATGAIELPIVPNVGDTVAFVFPKSANVALPGGFGGLLKVANRVFDAAGKSSVSLMLEDLTLDSIEDAERIAKYLAAGFGIVTDVH